ncbi:hypothetical protein [Mesorhizobium sp. NPDC059025]|uniref:hypothetical protein n=1 Tax=unclassified Mesorhizobium TaxID=325217 RepID=UPI0036A7F6DE
MADSKAKIAHDRANERYERQTDAGIQFAKQSFQALLLLNGGACIALLGFLANTFAKENMPQAQQHLLASMVASLRWFALGAFVTVLATVVAFLSNRGYADEGLARARIDIPPYLVETRASRIWHLWATATFLVSLIGALAGLGFFMVGLMSINAFI